MRRTTRVVVSHLTGQENLVKKVRLLLKSSLFFRSMLNKEDEGRLIKICLSTDVNECVEGLHGCDPNAICDYTVGYTYIQPLFMCQI